MTSGLDNVVDHSVCGGVKCYLLVLDKVLVGLDSAVNVKETAHFGEKYCFSIFFKAIVFLLVRIDYKHLKILKF